MKIYNMPQRTEEWFAVRRGKFTASNFGKLFMKAESIGYNSLINQVVFERLTGESPESFQNAWMERGTELEPEAIKAYEIITFTKVNHVGFVELDEWVGCSPDGLIGDDGLIQVKCPKYNVLIDYHLYGDIDKEYIYQMQGELFITDRKYNIFFAYHPKLRPFIKIVNRDETIINNIKTELLKAIEIAKKRIELLK